MNDLIGILTEYWPFILVIIIIACITFWLRQKRHSLLGFQEIDTVTAISMINHDDAVVMDIRPEKDFNQGHILNAINLGPEQYLSTGLFSDLSLPDHAPIIIYCRHGVDSARIAALLSREGKGRIFKLKGGLRSWMAAGLPVQRTLPGE